MDSVDKSAFYIYVFSHNKMARLGKGYSTESAPVCVHFSKVNKLSYNTTTLACYTIHHLRSITKLDLNIFVNFKNLSLNIVVEGN